MSLIKALTRTLIRSRGEASAAAGKTKPLRQDHAAFRFQNTRLPFRRTYRQ